MCYQRTFCEVHTSYTNYYQNICIILKRLREIILIDLFETVYFNYIKDKQ